MDDDHLAALADEIYHPKCSKFARRMFGEVDHYPRPRPPMTGRGRLLKPVTQAFHTSDPRLRLIFHDTVKSSLQTYRHLITNIRRLDRFYDSDSLAVFIRILQPHNDSTIEQNLETCWTLVRAHGHLMKARVAFYDILNFLVTYKDVLWENIPREKKDPFTDLARFNLKQLHRDAYTSIAELQRDLQHDDEVLSQGFPLPLSEKQWKDQNIFMKPPQNALSLPLEQEEGESDDAYTKRMARRRYDHDRLSLNQILTQVGHIPQGVPAENMVFDRYYLNCGEFIKKVLRQDHSVNDPRVLEELADSVYMTTSIYRRRRRYSYPCTFVALNSLSNEDPLKNSVSPPLLMTETQFNAAVRNGDYAHHPDRDAHFYIQRCKDLFVSRQALQTMHSRIDKILTFLSTYKHSEYADIPAEAISQFLVWTSNYRVSLSPLPGVWLNIRQRLQNGQKMSDDPNEVDQFVAAVRERWQKESVFLAEGMGKGRLSKCHMATPSNRLSKEEEDPTYPPLMRKSVKESMKVLTSHVPFLELYGYIGRGQQQYNDTLSRLDDLLEEEEQDQYKLCKDIFHFREYLLSQKRFVAKIIKYLREPSNGTVPAHYWPLIRRAQNIDFIPIGNLPLLERIAAHDDAVLLDMGIRGE